jgi:hypothetical protein
MKELDEALGLFDKTVPFLQDSRKGKNSVHSLMGLLDGAFAPVGVWSSCRV